jgi:hypothetical protein
MGKIKVTKKVEIEIDGVLCVDQDGKFLGEYFPGASVYVEHHPAPDGATVLSADTPSPPNHRCTWNGTGWDDPGPDQKEVERQKQRAEKEAENAAIANELTQKGYSEAAIKAIIARS